MPSKYKTMNAEDRRNFKKVSEDLNSNTSLTECHNGYWLWDKTQEMNLAMKADSREEALLEALEFYQKYYAKRKKELSDLKAKVDSFLVQFEPEDEWNQS